MFQDVPNGVGDADVPNPFGFIPEGGPIGAVFGVLLVSGTVIGAVSLVASTIAAAIPLGGRLGRSDEGPPGSSDPSMPVVSMMKNGLPSARAAISAASASSI